MSEDLLYAVSSIADALEIFKPASPWQELTRMEYKPGQNNWRTRFSNETNILIEEEELSYQYWRVRVTHIVESRNEAIALAASLTGDRERLLEQALEESRQQRLSEQSGDSLPY